MRSQRLDQEPDRAPGETAGWVRTPTLGARPAFLGRLPDPDATDKTDGPESMPGGLILCRLRRDVWRPCGVRVPNDHVTSRRNVLVAARGPTLALNDEVDGRTNGQGDIKECVPVNGSAANDCLAPPITVDPRGQRILDVYLPDITDQLPQRFDRLTLAIQDHVRRVEIHTDVGRLQLAQHAAEGVRGFLTGFPSHTYIVVGEDFSDRPQSINQLGAFWAAFIFGNEATVEGHQLNARSRGQPRDLLGLDPIDEPRVIGPDPSGSSDGFERRVILTGHGHHSASDPNA